MTHRSATLLLFAAFLVVAVTPASFAGELKIAFRLGTEVARTEPYSAVLRASAEAAGDQPALAMEKEVTVPGTTILSLAVGRIWRLALRSEEIWLPETVVLGPEAPESLVLDAWRLGTLEGRIVLLDEEKTAPDALDALVSPAPETPAPQSFARSAFRCPVHEGRWICKLPAGVVDLKLKAKGFMPSYFWSLLLPLEKGTDLGKLALRRGSAVSGRVELDGRPKEGTRTTIELVPLETAQRPAEEKPGEAQRQGFRREVQEPNTRGFFLFADVPPGGYELVARHEGFAEATSGPVNVRKNVEMELAEPLVLAPPLSIEASIDPPVDPWGDPWVVGISRYASGPIPRLLSKTSSELSGWWKREGLAPGEYLLEVGRADVGGYHSERIDLSRGSATLQISIPILKVHGKVLLGEEPLEADLHLDNGSASVRLSSDPEGEFEGMLTEPGDWKAVVVARKMQLMKRLRVEVRPAAGSDHAELLIELTDNRLRGRVVDERGKGVRGTVFAIGMGKEGPRSTGTTMDGDFELRGLESEQFLVNAETPDDEVSDKISIQIENKLEPEPLDLVVRPKVAIAGRVVFEGRGIAEAEVSAVPSHEPLSFAATTATDVEGSFKLKLPKGTSHAVLTIKARGFALRTLTVPVEPGKSIDIPLSQVSGNLLLELDEQPDLDFRSGISYCLSRNGTCFGLPILANWARANGGEGWVEPLRFSVPNLEIGDWAFCVVKNTDLVATMLGAPPPGRCVSGTVLPGGELSLRVPAPPKLE